MNTDSVTIADTSGTPLSLGTTSDDSVSSLQEFLKDPSPIGQDIRPPPSTDVTALRELEAKLIEDLKLLKRRREALKDSYGRGEINQENYRTNVENNELQSRDAYVVLQQIQNAIREYLGLPTQPAAAFRHVTSEAIQSDTTANVQTQLSSAESQTLTPEEELSFIQSEIDGLKKANTDLLQALQRLRMPNVRTLGADTASTKELLVANGGTSAPSNRFMDTVDTGMMAHGGSVPTSQFDDTVRSPFEIDLNLGVSDSIMPSPSPVPAVSGFDSRSDRSLPSQDLRNDDQTSLRVFDNERSQFPYVRGDFLSSGTNDPRRSQPLPDRNNVNAGRSVGDEIQILMDEYNALSQREEYILRMLNRNRQDRTATARRRNEFTSRPDFNALPGHEFANKLTSSEPQMRRYFSRVVSPVASSSDVDETMLRPPFPSPSVSENSQSVIERPVVRSRLPSEALNDFTRVDNALVRPSAESSGQFLMERSLVGSGGSAPSIDYIDDQTPIDNRQVRPVVDRSDFANLGSQQRNRDRNLVYNDGTITVAAVQPVGTLEGDAPDPATPVSGFSAEADGQLPPRRNTLWRQNRRVPFRNPFGSNFVSRNSLLLRNGGGRVLPPRVARTQPRRTQRRRPLNLI